MALRVSDGAFRRLQRKLGVKGKKPRTLKSGVRRKQLQPAEDAIQAEVVRFLERALPKGSLFTHIASGGLRSRGTAGKLYAQGVRRGAPDLVIIAPCDTGKRLAGRVVVWIEMKSATGVLSEEQERWRDALLGAREIWALCRSAQEVAYVLLDAGVSLKQSPYASINPDWRQDASTPASEGARHE